MTVIEGLRSHLLALTDISTIVGVRIYPLRIPQKPTLPAIALLHVDSRDVAEHLRGPGNVWKDRIQVDCWAAKQDDAIALAKLVRWRLHGFTGHWMGTGSPQPFIHVQQAQFVDGSEHFEPDILGGLNRHRADYFVKYTSSDDVILAFE